MALQASIIDGKLVPERHPCAMVQADSEKEIWGIWGPVSDSIGEAGADLVGRLDG